MITELSFIYFRHCPLCSGTDESEDMNDNLDNLLISNLKKHHFKINYVLDRDLTHLYEIRSILLF